MAPRSPAKGIHPWQDVRGSRVAELLAEGLGDLVIVAGDPPERVQASKLLLTAASQPLASQLKLADLLAHSEVRWPELTAGAASAVVECSCGIDDPFRGCSAADVEASSRMATHMNPTSPLGARRYQSGVTSRSLQHHRFFSRPLSLLSIPPPRTIWS